MVIVLTLDSNRNTEDTDLADLGGFFSSLDSPRNTEDGSFTKTPRNKQVVTGCFNQNLRNCFIDNFTLYCNLRLFDLPYFQVFSETEQ
jgi:hypothetical protein